MLLFWFLRRILPTLSPGWLRTEYVALVGFEFTALLPTSPSVTVSFLWLLRNTTTKAIYARKYLRGLTASEGGPWPSG